MCKAACQNKCKNESLGIACAAERAAQHTPAVKIPVGLRESAKVAPSYNMEASFDGKTWFEVCPVTAVEGLDDAMAGLPTYPYPHDLPEPRTPVSWPQIQQAHEAARTQSAMHEACAIASALAAESRKGDDPEPLAALMRHVGTQEHATLQLLKLVGRIGLRQWFDGDFVVLSQEEARNIAMVIDPAGVGRARLDLLESKIKAAGQ